MVLYSILQSNKAGVANMLEYGLSLNLSVERNPKCNFLIPYFGLAFGELTQERFNTLQFTPMGGIFLYYEEHCGSTWRLCIPFKRE